MAVRARPDNLALDHPADEASAAPVEFHELWEHRDDLQALCRRMIGDEGRADDVVQETFLRAIANAKQLDRRVSFAPWLITVARRRSIDQLRADARVRTVSAPPELPGAVADDPVEHVLQQERVERVHAALAELSVRERQLLLRQLAHGLSLAELAAEEATSVASVRSVLSRARSKLRCSLERGGPLGAAPVPGVVASVKRRFHRWAARLEGNTPMLAGAGIQFGDAMVAAVAAIALLLAGNAPSVPSPSDIVTSLASSEDELGPARHVGRSRSGATDQAAATATSTSTSTTTSTTTSTSTPASPWSPLGEPPGVDDVPWLPDEGAGQPEGTSIESFALSGDGETVYAVGVSTTGISWPLYRSDDEGETWDNLEPKGFAGGRLLVPANSPVLFAVTGGPYPLLQSDDGGALFRPVAPARGAATLLPPPDAGGAKVLVATPELMAYDSSGVGTSTPVGVGPTATTPSSVAVPLDYATNPVALVAGKARSDADPRVSESVVFRCTKVSCSKSVLPGATGGATLHVARDTPGLVLATAGSKLFRSTDDGGTFAAVALPTRVQATYLADGGTGELLLASIGVRGVGAGLYRSTDQGQSWAKVTTDTALDNGAQSVVRTASGRLIAAFFNGPGLLCSDDGGATWAPRCS